MPAGKGAFHAVGAAAYAYRWRRNVWPQGWDGSEVRADAMIPMVRVTGDQRGIVTQELLVR